jgi:hypothetical protein
MYPLGAKHSEGAFLKKELIIDSKIKWRQQQKKK